MFLMELRKIFQKYQVVLADEDNYGGDEICVGTDYSIYGEGVCIEIDSHLVKLTQEWYKNS